MEGVNVVYVLLCVMCFVSSVLYNREFYCAQFAQVQ